jgi:hypothetical protein
MSEQGGHPKPLDDVMSGVRTRMRPMDLIEGAKLLTERIGERTVDHEPTLGASGMGDAAMVDEGLPVVRWFSAQPPVGEPAHNED